jgi:hypothetical protein
MTRELGRVPAPNDEHIRKYGLADDFFPDTPTSMVGGSDWYENFDEPVWDTYYNIWRIGRGDLGAIRGGHAYCLPKKYADDIHSWWKRYDQGSEGACVGFGLSRALSQENRVFLDALWLYNEAKKIDPWEGENYDGTDVNSALKIASRVGHRRIWGGESSPPSINYGVSVYRWARSAEDIARCLGDDRIWKRNAIPINNSWGNQGRRVGTSWVGNGYPHVVWLDIDVVIERLLPNFGEFAVFVDR